jgi:hypothetical protein
MPLGRVAMGGRTGREIVRERSKAWWVGVRMSEMDFRGEVWIGRA